MCEAELGTGGLNLVPVVPRRRAVILGCRLRTFAWQAFTIAGPALRVRRSFWPEISRLGFD